MKYHEFDHPYVEGIMHMYKEMDWSFFIVNILYLFVLITIVVYVWSRRKTMNKRRIFISLFTFLAVTVFFIGVMTMTGGLKKGYYEGEITVTDVAKISQTDEKGILFDEPSTPESLKALVISKDDLEKSKVKKGDTIKVKTDASYAPHEGMSFIVVESKDIKHTK